MIIYNVTILIAENRADEFEQWMRSEHIPEVMNTGLFTQANFCKLQDPPSEEKGETYATQYFCDSQENLQNYYENCAPKLREEGIAKFGNDMLGFRTELKLIQTFYPNS